MMVRYLLRQVVLPTPEFGVLCGCEGPVTSADWGTGAVDDADVQSNAVNRRTTVAKGFERDAKRIACLMRDRYNLGLVDVGGYAARAYQGAANGYLAGYRIVLHGVFKRQFGPSPEKLDHVFPGAKLQDLKNL